MRRVAFVAAGAVLTALLAACTPAPLPPAPPSPVEVVDNVNEAVDDTEQQLVDRENEALEMLEGK